MAEPSVRLGVLNYAPVPHYSNTPVIHLSSPLYFPFRHDYFVIRVAFPDDVSRHAINFRKRIERHDGRIFHDNSPCLLQYGDALFVIAGALLFFYELVEIRIAIAGALGDARVEVLVIECVGIVSRSAGVVERQLAAVDSVSAPIDRVFLRYKLNLNAALAELVRDDLAHFFAFEMAVGGEIKLHFQTGGITGFGEQLARLFWIEWIAFDGRIVADHVRAQWAVKHVAVPFINVFQNDVRVDGIIESLAYQLVVKRLVGGIHGQKIHAIARNFFNPRARILANA